jgi:hypothetical protein
MGLRPARKALFLALAVCMAFSLFFAELAIADEIDHDCAGDGCPVCLAIVAAHNFLKSLKPGGAAPFLAVCPAFLAQTAPNSVEFAPSLHSPIALKTRFNS